MSKFKLMTSKGSRLIAACMVAAALTGFTSCADKNDEFDDHGSSTVLSLTAPSQAYMGDSILFNYSVQGNGFRLDQSKIQLYLGTSLASERIMITPHDGDYSGKLWIPFGKNVADQDVTIKVRTQNERYAADVKETTMRIERPKYDKLTLVLEDGRQIEMLPTSNPYEFSTPVQAFGTNGQVVNDVYGVIKAPAYGSNGNPITFGQVDGKISNGIEDFIHFSAGDGNSTAFPITINTLTYEGSPFVKFAVLMGEEEFDFDGAGQAANCYAADCKLKRNDLIEMSGIAPAEYADFWINPAFFRVVKNTDRTKLRFQGKEGMYRIICDKAKKYFRVFPLNADGNGAADRRNGDDIYYIIGNNGIGFPSYASNSSNWNATEGNIMPVCPIADGVYQLVWETGRTLNANSVNWKLFYQNGWGSEVLNDNFETMVTQGVAAFDLGAQSDNGNIGKGSALQNNKVYIITFDQSDGGKIKWSCEEYDSVPEVDE